MLDWQQLADADLLDAFYAGEQGALTVLVHRWQDRLDHFLRERGCRAVDVEDLLQETWLRVLGTREQGNRFVRAMGSVAGWLCQIALRTSVDWHRRRQVRAALPLRADDADEASVSVEAIDTSPGVAAPPPEVSEWHELQQALQECLQQLEEKELQVLSLWQGGLGQLTLTDIAAQLGVSPATVYRIKEQALEKLRRQLRQKEVV